MAKDFLTLIDCLNLTQSLPGQTHDKGHTLDLVLSYGLCLYISEICLIYSYSPLLACHQSIGGGVQLTLLLRQSFLK